MDAPAFCPSPTPVEDYDASSDQEWAVEGIVGESTDAFGVKRYEIKWGEGWTRKDGTNTTWDRPAPDSDLTPLVNMWESRQAEKRAARVAAQGMAVEVGVERWHMLHEDATVERARGYMEAKTAYVRAHPELDLAPDGDGAVAWPSVAVDFDGTRKSLGAGASSSGSQVLTSDGGSERRSKVTTRSGSSSTPRGSSALSRQNTLSRPQTPARAPPSASASGSGRGRRSARQARRIVSPVSDSSESELPQLRRQPPAMSREAQERRAKVQRRWTRATGNAGAAAVTIVNEVDGDGAPPLVSGFQYLERSYARAADVPANEDIMDCLVSCNCSGRRCLFADECDCQEPSELRDDSDEKIFAYTKGHLFNFKLPRGTEVIECNDSCECDEKCRNRVAQRPRSIPIEVFKTLNRGWGARATEPLRRGQVTGIYTGRRAEAVKRQNTERGAYIFDLDVRESHESDDYEDGINDDDGINSKFSIDGYAHGNWTRFINHSCEPNMRVYPVVWDTIPELNQPYLAFVATQDIESRTELTIDYDPQAEEGEEAPASAKKCMCGAARCRGWVRV